MSFGPNCLQPHGFVTNWSFSNESLQVVFVISHLWIYFTGEMLNYLWTHGLNSVLKVTNHRRTGLHLSSSVSITYTRGQRVLLLNAALQEACCLLTYFTMSRCVDRVRVHSVRSEPKTNTGVVSGQIGTSEPL